MSEAESTRRQFLRACGRYAGAAAAAGVAGGLVFRADADKVWQIDPSACTTCANFLDANGWGRCASQCVLKDSAVRVVNDFHKCGYCLICPGYHDVRSPADQDNIPTGLVCPQDAIRRRQVGYYDPSDPNNAFFEYTIDESKCNGCGKCVEGCKPPQGNGSFRLAVRHDLCVDCNRCSIAQACPADAFYRAEVVGDRPGSGRTLQDSVEPDQEHP